MMLATLFMGMAFLAITNPPNWMPPDFSVGSKNAGKAAASAAPSPAPAPSADESRETITSCIAFLYLGLNTATFAMALMTVVMPFIAKVPRAEDYVRGTIGMMACVYITFSCSFVVGISNDPHVLGVVVGIFAVYAILPYLGIRFLFSKPEED